MKKRLFCILLGALLSLSLPLSVFAVDDIIGTEPMDDPFGGIGLVQTTAPEGAVAVGYNYAARTEVYYRVNGATLNLPNGYPYPNELLAGDIASPDVIIGDNSRTRVTDTQSMPYSAIAYIEGQFANGDPIRATAFMISENVAMTAAHCLFKQNCTHDSANWATSIAVYPGRNASDSPYGVAYATEVIVSAPYYTESKIFHETTTEGGDVVCGCKDTLTSNYYDWGLIRLDWDIGEESGYFGYQYNNQSSGMQLSLTGYPGGENSTPFLYTANGLALDTTYAPVANFDRTYVLFCNIDATAGQSGSPIYRYSEANNKYMVYAIYTTGYAEGEWFNGIINQGSRITSQLFSFILAYTSL